MKLLKAMATVAGLTGVSRILGFIRDVMTAAILGAGPVADAFFVALKLPNFFRRVTAEGAFSVSFVPLYAAKLETEGKDGADDFASNAFMVMIVCLLPFTMAAMLAMPLVIHLIAPGFSVGEQRYDLAVEYTRVTFPYLLMMSLTALMGGVLNARGRFAPFAAAPILFNLVLIVALYGATPFLETAGHALSWGLFAAGVLQFLGLLISVRMAGVNLRLRLPRFNGDMKKLFKLMGPGVIGAGVVHINLFADIIIASMLEEGSISYLYYADRLNQLPLGMVGIAVGTALLPMLSAALASGNAKEAQHLFNRALEVCLLLALPAAVALFVVADPLVSVLFERGEFTADNALKTVHVLMGYAIGLPAYITIKVFSTAYWSRQDTASPVKISVFCTLLNIALALGFINFTHMGVAGIALATGIAGWVQFFIMRAGLKSMEAARLDERFKRAAPRIVLSSCLMGGALYMIAALSHDYYDGTTIEKALALTVLVASGLIIYGAAVTLSGAVKISDLKKYFVRRKKPA
jgi:putative peptidoglycan lipid II flippase